jgi:hypothetical protein
MFSTINVLGEMGECSIFQNIDDGPVKWLLLLGKEKKNHARRTRTSMRTAGYFIPLS